MADISGNQSYRIQSLRSAAAETSLLYQDQQCGSSGGSRGGGSLGSDESPLTQLNKKEGQKQLFKMK